MRQLYVKPVAALTICFALMILPACEPDSTRQEPVASWTGEAVPSPGAEAAAEIPSLSPGQEKPPVSAVEESALPPAEEIINKYYEARGGKQAMEEITSRVERGQVKVPAMSISGSYVAYIEPPNQYNRSEFAVMGTVENGISDGVNWTLNPVFGNSAKKTGEKAVLDQVLGWEERFSSVKCIGRENSDGTNYLELAFTPEDGEPTIMLFDETTGLLYRVVVPVPGGTNEIRTYSDYKEVDGVLFPHGFARQGGVANVQITFDSVEFGAEISDGQFDLPAKIKDLLGDSVSEDR